MPREVEKPYNSGQWTEARFNGFIKSMLRRGSVRWPVKAQVKKEAEVGKKINKSSGRIAMHFLCAGCKGEFPNSKVQVDHIEPIIDPTKGFTTWDDCIKRMFCEKDNLQVLCTDCHKIKTDMEKEIAKNRK